MIRAIGRRLVWTVAVVWFVVTATFAATTLIPADPARALLGPHASAEVLDQVRAHYCLDRGAVGRYGCWLARVAHGDLGESYRSHRAVTAVLADRVWPTLQLALAAILLQLVIGVPLGVLAAVRRGRWPDHAVQIGTLIGQSAPAFFVGAVLVYVVAYRWGWLPISGYGQPGWDRLAHLVLPAITLATVGIAFYARVVRSELADVLAEDYVRTARAKGAGEARVIGHALRNALGPLVTLVGLDLGMLVGAAVVTEVVFAWPGLGRELTQAILEADLPLIVGVVMTSAIAIALANLAADLVQLWLDPRQRDE